MRLPPARDGLCVRCGRRAESWQHRVAKGRGGPTDEMNCVRLCGDGTRGCHGWAEHHPEQAQAVFLDIPGSFVRGYYTGPDPLYRSHYNGERWDDVDGWTTAGKDPACTS
jgi:hypothetical protein